MKTSKLRPLDTTWSAHSIMAFLLSVKSRPCSATRRTLTSRSPIERTDGTNLQRACGASGGRRHDEPDDEVPSVGRRSGGVLDRQRRGLPHEVVHVRDEAGGLSTRPIGLRVDAQSEKPTGLEARYGHRELELVWSRRVEDGGHARARIFYPVRRGVRCRTHPLASPVRRRAHAIVEDADVVWRGPQAMRGVADEHFDGVLVDDGAAPEHREADRHDRGGIESVRDRQKAHDEYGAGIPP